MKLFRMVVVLYNFLLTRILPACHLSSRPWCWVLSYFSCVCLFVTPWTVASQAPLSMGFSRQEYWSGLACPPPGNLPDSGIEPASLKSPACSLPLAPPGKPPLTYMCCLSDKGTKKVRHSKARSPYVRDWEWVSLLLIPP